MLELLELEEDELATLDSELELLETGTLELDETLLDIIDDELLTTDELEYRLLPPPQTVSLLNVSK